MTLKLNLKPKSVQLVASNPFPDIPDPLGYGQRAVDFLRTLKHPLSTLPDNAFPLDPWVEKIIRQIYGPRNANGSRIVRRVILYVPRGNRKTTLAAALVLLHGKGPERRANSQIVSVASDKDQAKLTLNEIAAMIDPDYAFAPNIGNSAKTVDMLRGAKIRKQDSTITFPGGIQYKARSSDAMTAQGLSPCLVVADELHAWQKRDPRALWAAVKLGAGKVANSLVVVTTTAGAGRENLAWDVISDARRIASGEVNDPSTLPIFYEAPRDADWRDEKVWFAVNPGLKHGYPDIDALRIEAREAERLPAQRMDFQRYRLNIWQDSNLSSFVDMDLYDRCDGPVDLDAMEGLPCWIGCDLSATTDLSAIVCCWRDGDDYFVHPFIFVPGESLYEKGQRDGVPYELWKEDGFIEPTSGAVIDVDRIEAKIRELCARFQVAEIAFDPWRAQVIASRLTEDGLPAVLMQQGTKTMGPAIDALEKAVIGGKLHHGGHPALRWAISNIAVRTDENLNRAFDKKHSTARIDAAQAMAMAVGRAFMEGGEDNSLYTDPANSDLFIW
jgi:phage terminase large subunit-like protein